MNTNKTKLIPIKQNNNKKVFFLSNPTLYLYIYYVHFVAFLLRIFNLFFSKENSSIICIDETQQYIEKQKQIFLNLFDKDTNKIDSEKWNANIDPRCYSTEFLNELITQENNELELQWKRRLLHESTPRGNIIMYYDFYKQAFAYVSDQQMNYAILNACAMKYVRIYRCFDFFVDVHLLPFGIISPFSLLQEENEKKEKEKTIEKKKEMGIMFGSNAPFIKPKVNSELKSILKTKSVTFSTEIETSSKNTSSSSSRRDFCNVFRYLGKISNLQLLVKIEPIKQHPVLSIPVESFDYLSYKKMQNKT